jgi:hypothetical protein
LKQNKNYIGKHCSNQRCFKEKKLNCQPTQYEKNKYDKNIFGKKTSIKKKVGKHCSKAKIMWENTVAIYSVLNNYKAKFSISLI